MIVTISLTIREPNKNTSRFNFKKTGVNKQPLCLEGPEILRVHSVDMW